MGSLARSLAAFPVGRPQPPCRSVRVALIGRRRRPLRRSRHIRQVRSQTCPDIPANRNNTSCPDSPTFPPPAARPRSCRKPDHVPWRLSPSSTLDFMRSTSQSLPQLPTKYADRNSADPLHTQFNHSLIPRWRPEPQQTLTMMRTRRITLPTDRRMHVAGWHRSAWWHRPNPASVAGREYRGSLRNPSSARLAPSCAAQP